MSQDPFRSTTRGRPADTGDRGCLACTHMDGGVYCSNDSTCPRSPGDRDQQQAAERIVARIVARPWREQRDVIAAALDAARAEEAARWQAKIKTLATDIERPGSEAAKYLAARLRAVLDGER